MIIKKVLFFLLVLLGIFTGVKAQTPSDTLVLKKVFGGYQVYQNGKPLNMNNLTNLMMPYEKPYQLLKKAKLNNGFAMAFGLAGGFLIGWPVGTALGGGDPNWVLAGVGAGLFAISIPFSIQVNKKTKEAVLEYNGLIKKPETSSLTNKVKFQIALSSNGLGLHLRF